MVPAIWTLYLNHRAPGVGSLVGRLGPRGPGRLVVSGDLKCWPKLGTSPSSSPGPVEASELLMGRGGPGLVWSS